MTRDSFDPELQQAFAELSGDFNPVHVDPLAARRYLFGRQVVHGVHGLLWALERWLAADSRVTAIGHLRAFFERPIGMHERITLHVGTDTAGATLLEVFADGIRSTRIVVRPADAPSAGVAINSGAPPRRACRERAVEELLEASGDIDLYLDETSARRLFPRLHERLPGSQLALLLATTRLVGMECPGLHSVLAELDLDFGRAAPASDRLRYEVRRYDQRFASLTLNLCGAGADGTIKTFVRPSPHAQARFAELRTLVEAAEFSGQRALIVGGSRGLGEVTAKLLAAGGAEVVLTYHRGGDDAEKVAADIVAGGGHATAAQVDVLGDDHDFAAPELREFSPSHLYYFATPPIFVGAKGLVQPDLFRRFCDYYVSGFVNVLNAIRRTSPGALEVFYPSSVAIDETPAGMAEYAAAKAAGETLCRVVAKHDRLVKIYCPRLPRAATDQTASLIPVHNEDPATIMLKHLRMFRELRVSPTAAPYARAD